MNPFDPDGYSSRTIKAPPSRMKNFKLDPEVVAPYFKTEADEQRYYAQLAKIFQVAEQPAAEFSVRTLMPPSCEKLGAMTKIFEGAIGEQKDLDKIVDMQVKQEELDRRKERLEQQFQECVQKLRDACNGIPCVNLHACYQKACELNPDSFLPHRYFLLTYFLEANSIDEIKDLYFALCEKVYKAFPFETYLTLMTFVDQRVMSLEMKTPNFLELLKVTGETLNFLLQHHPYDHLLHRIAFNLKIKFPAAVVEGDEAGTLKAFNDLCTLGMNAWLQGDALKARSAWIQAKQYNYTHSDPYFCLALYHSHMNDVPQAEKLLAKAIQVASMITPEERLASLELQEEFKQNIPPIFLLLQNFLEFQKQLHRGDRSQIDTYLDILIEQFCITNTESTLLIARHIIGKLYSLDHLPHLPLEKVRHVTLLYASILHNHLKETKKTFYNDHLLTCHKDGTTVSTKFIMEVPKNADIWLQLYLEALSHLNFAAIYDMREQIVIISQESPERNSETDYNFHLFLPILLLLQKKEEWDYLMRMLKTLAPYLSQAPEPVKNQIASLLVDWALDRAIYCSKEELTLAAEVFQSFETHLKELPLFVNVLAGTETEFEPDVKSPLGILTALIAGKKVNFNTRDLCRHQKQKLIPTILYLTQVDNNPGALFHAAWPPFSKGLNPHKDLMINMLHLGMELKARAHYLPIYYFPNPDQTFGEIFTKSDLYFGHHFQQPIEQQRAMLEERRCPNVYSPKKKIEFTLNESSKERPVWPFSFAFPFEVTKALYDLLHQSQVDLLEKRRVHQASIDNEAPKYTDSAEFIAWVKEDPEIIRAITKGSEVNRKSLTKYGEKVIVEFLCDLKEKRAHHLEIEKLKAANKSFMQGNGKHPYHLHYLAATLIAAVHEKSGECNLYFSTQEEAFAVFQLIYEYTKQHLIRHFLEQKHLNLKSSFTLESLKGVIAEVNTQLAGAFHGPEIHVFGRGPRYPHYNAGVFFKGEKPVNTHLYFGNFL